MSLKLILMRHAKSDWNDHAQDDFDRPLSDRGRKSASVIGAWLAENGHLPDVALISSAQRTVETWVHVAGQLPRKPKLDSTNVLYLADAATTLSVLRNQKVPSVMMIGHNPGFAIFASAICRIAPDHPKFTQYPTAATTVFEFDAENWAGIGARTGKVLDFVVPRDLLS